MYPGCVVEIRERVLSVDLIELAVFDFDVILRMDQLSENYASIDCNDKYVWFRSKKGTEFVFQGDRTEVHNNLISALKASRLLEKGCQGYLAYVMNRDVKPFDVQMIPKVGEFLEVFSKELPGVPPERKIEFSIELTPGTNPISIALYRMALLELRELNVQL